MSDSSVRRGLDLIRLAVLTVRLTIELIILLAMTLIPDRYQSFMTGIYGGGQNNAGARSLDVQA